MANEKVNGHDANDEPVEKHEKARAEDAAAEAERRMRERHAQQSEEPQARAQAGEQAAEQAGAQPGPQVVQSIHIDLYDNGAVNVNGPMEDPILFSGMLAMAQHVAQRQWNKLMDQAERRALEAQRLAASVQGKKGAMRNMFGRIGRGFSRTA